MTYNHILLAIDRSEDSGKILDRGNELSVINSSKKSLVTVIEALPLEYADLYIAAERHREKDTKDILIKRGSLVGINPEDCHLLKGHPADEIRHLCDELDIDLLVMGSHCRRGLKRIALGSTANSVLHGLKNDVHIVKV